jgi:hypothetical protein
VEAEYRIEAVGQRPAAYFLTLYYTPNTAFWQLFLKTVLAPINYYNKCSKKIRLKTAAGGGMENAAFALI